MYKERNINLGLKDIKKEVPHLYSTHEWLNDIDKTLFATSLEDLDKTFQNNF